MSVLPTSPIAILSGISINGDIFVQQALTRSAELILSRHNRKNAKSLGHYCRDSIQDFLNQWHLNIDFEMLKKRFYLFDDLN